MLQLWVIIIPLPVLIGPSIRTEDTIVIKFHNNNVHVPWAPNSTASNRTTGALFNIGVQQRGLYLYSRVVKIRGGGINFAP